MCDNRKCNEIVSVVCLFFASQIDNLTSLQAWFFQLEINYFLLFLWGFLKFLFRILIAMNVFMVVDRRNRQHHHVRKKPLVEVPKPSKVIPWNYFSQHYHVRKKPLVEVPKPSKVILWNYFSTTDLLYDTLDGATPSLAESSLCAIFKKVYHSCRPQFGGRYRLFVQ